MKIRYVGSFPPPYGGVTVKNRLIFGALSEKLNIIRFAKPKWLPARLEQPLNLLLSLFPNQKLVIGVSAAGGKSWLLTRMLYKFNRKSMRRSIYFMMGGTEAGSIADSSDKAVRYAEYRKIYVETRSMEKKLRDAGLTNAEFFPNCRMKPATNFTVTENTDSRLQCLFFSLVRKDKGVDMIFETAKRLPEVDFTIYGNVDEAYKDEFNAKLSGAENVKYNGVFSAGGDETYKLMHRFDVLMLPTLNTCEGVPGVLVEAKLAGIVNVVTDISYNAEIVCDGVDGIVLKENTVDGLEQAISKLNDDRELLKKLKAGALVSAESYYIDKYIGDFVDLLNS